MTVIAASRTQAGLEAGAGALRAVADLSAAIERADRPALEQLLHPLWTGKHAAADGTARVETREAFIAHCCSDGRWRGRRHVSAVMPCFSDFAIVRTDDWQAASASFLLMFREHGRWRIAGEASAGAEDGSRDAHFSPRRTEAGVLAVLGEYYRAVTEGDPDGVRRIFAPFWTMTNHEADLVVSEGVEAFAARLDKPLPTYWNDRQISDVQIIADRLAYVRVDRPSTPSTTVFLFMRLGGRWLVIDKAWTDGRKPD